MTYLLDTCILSLFSRGDPGVLARLKSMPPEKICLSVVTLLGIRSESTSDLCEFVKQCLTLDLARRLVHALHSGLQRFATPNFPP